MPLIERAGLEELSGECYATVQGFYDDMMGPALVRLPLKANA